VAFLPMPFQGHQDVYQDSVRPTVDASIVSKNVLDHSAVQSASIGTESAPENIRVVMKVLNYSPLLSKLHFV